MPTIDPAQEPSTYSIELLKLPKSYAVAALSVGVVMALLSLWFAPPVFARTGVALALVLAWLGAVDLVRYRLPNLLTYPLILLGLAHAWLLDSPIVHHVVGTAVGYGVFRLVSVGAEKILKKPALGLGDAKLLAVFGAWLGWAALPTVLLVGSGVGLLHAVAMRAASGDNKAAIPLGPALIIGFWTVWLFGPIGGALY